MYGSGAVSCSCSLLIRGPNLARCQAEAPLIALCRFSKPALLNSFYSKIITGYALGIYDDGIRDNLHIVRNIRNAFAHSRKLIRFDHPAVVNELRKATRTALPKKSWKFKAQHVDIRAPGLYMRLCYWLSNKLGRVYIRRMKYRTYNPTRSDYVKALLNGKTTGA